MRTGARAAKLDFDTPPPQKHYRQHGNVPSDWRQTSNKREKKKERTVLAEKPVEKGELMGGNLAAEKEK